LVLLANFSIPLHSFGLSKLKLEIGLDDLIERNSHHTIIIIDLDQAIVTS